MIAYIQGVVKSVGAEERLVVLTQGIGYEVVVSTRILQSTHVGAEIELWTYQAVREDSIELFGFSSAEEQQLFLECISVSGVGPRTAMALFSGFQVDELQRAIAAQDTALLSSVNGIGKKTAERIVLELKDRIGVVAAVSATTSGNGADASAAEALLSLGYSHSEVAQALAQVDGSLSVEEQVRTALQQLGS